MAGGHHSMGERSRRSGSAAGAAQRCRSLRLPRDLRRSTSQRSMKRPGTERIGKLAVARNVAELRRRVRAWRRAGETVALVPTMGALHAGHLALVMRARELCDRVVASLFVNPTQFAPNEDFARYPRDESGDAAKLAAARCDLLYAPPLEEMYPQGFSTSVSVGEKDWQQLQVIRRVVRDLDIAVRIEGVPIVREADGLALSSRNAYLSPAERAAAPASPRSIMSTRSRPRRWRRWRAPIARVASSPPPGSAARGSSTTCRCSPPARHGRHAAPRRRRARGRAPRHARRWAARSEEHTSELQSRSDLVCRLLL